MKQIFGEIVESTLSEYKISCWKWDKMPKFGSIINIKQDDLEIFGVTTNIETSSIDSERYAFPFRKSESELKKEQPQIFSLLQTIVSCIPLGYIKRDQKPNYQTPPYPPKIHAFVGEISQATDLSRFLGKTDYIHMLANGRTPIFLIEEILLAIFKQLIDVEILTDGYINKCINIFAASTGNDYKKLKSFIERVEQIQG